MDDSWMFVGALLLVAIVPFALFGMVRFVAWAAPAHVRWAAGIERRFYRAYWLILGGTYVVVGILHLVHRKGEPVFGAAFVSLGLVAGWRGMRGRPAQGLGNGPKDLAPPHDALQRTRCACRRT
jgi:hypothetical protein